MLAPETHTRRRQGGPNGARFTASSLRSLGPGDHTDPGCEGLQLRVRKRSGGFSRTWRYRYLFAKEWVRQTIGHFPTMPLVEARRIANDLREKKSAGIDPRRALPRRQRAPTPPAARTGTTPHSIEHLAREFMERHVAPNRKRPEYVAALLARNVLPVWAGRDVRTITPRDVIELLDGIVERGSRVMANRTAGALSQMFRYGVHRALLESSPVQLLYRPGGKEKPRERTLSDAELRAYLQDPRACTRYERLERVINVLLLTGQRRGELAAARWADVDLDARTWRIPDEHSKTGRGHVVPLSDWAAEEFRSLKRESSRSRYVIPDPSGDKPIDPKQLTRSLAKCRARFAKRGIAPFTLHDLRRTCRTGLAKLQIPPHIAERVLNHAQEKIAGTYDVHDYLNEKREALNQWAARLRGVVE